MLYKHAYSIALCVCVDTRMERGRINEYFCAFSNKPTSIPELRRLNRGLRHGGDDYCVPFKPTLMPHVMVALCQLHEG